MVSERSIQHNLHPDVSTGFRKRRYFSTGQVLELQVIRTRRFSFAPCILAAFKSENEGMSELLRLLYLALSFCRAAK